MKKTLPVILFFGFLIASCSPLAKEVISEPTIIPTPETYLQYTDWKSGIGDAETPFAQKYSNEAVLGENELEQLTMTIMCRQPLKNLWIMFHFKQGFADIGDGFPPVKVSFDGQTDIQMTANSTDDEEYIGFILGKAEDLLLNYMLKFNIMKFEFTPKNAHPVYVTFDLTGIHENITSILDDCVY
jgi:hypothetical protein